MSMPFKDFDFSNFWKNYFEYALETVAEVTPNDVILEQISRLKYLISLPDTDVLFSTYDSADEALKDLEEIEAGIVSRDINALNKLHYMVLPTGDLQDISISSGWGHEFLKIAETIDNALLEIGAAMKRFNREQEVAALKQAFLNAGYDVNVNSSQIGTFLTVTSNIGLFAFAGIGESDWVTTMSEVYKTAADAYKTEVIAEENHFYFGSPEMVEIIEGVLIHGICPVPNQTVESLPESKDYTNLIEMAAILTNNNEKAVADAALMAERDAFQEKYLEWSDAYCGDDSNVLLAFAYWFVGHDNDEYADYAFGSYHDWKDGLEEILPALDEAIKNLGYSSQIGSLTEQIKISDGEEVYMPEAQDIINVHLNKCGFTLIYLDTDGDCYHFFIVPSDKLARLKELADEVVFRFYEREQE